MRALLILGLVLAMPAVAQPAGETLQMEIPPDYRLTYEQRDPDWTATEWLPDGQQRGAWREQLMCQVMQVDAIVTPTAFRDAFAGKRRGACTMAPIREGRDNGYRYALWAASCTDKSETGRAEEVWYKALRGRDVLYLVRKAFSYTPPDEEVVKWVAYLERVQLCDPRLPDRPCRRR